MKNTVKRLVALSLALVMCLTFVACGSKDNGGSTGIKDTFIYAVGGAPSSLDNANAGDSVSAYFQNQITYPLFYIGEDGSMVNAACESYTVEKNAAGFDVYTFKLVENYWSDGVKVTAKDYVDGMKHALAIGLDDASYGYFIADYVEGAAALYEKTYAEMANWTGAVAKDESTLVITLDAPCPYFVSLLACGVYCPVRYDFCKDTFDSYEWANDPAVPTCGPYHPVEVDLNSQVKMVKNEYFVNKDKVVTPTLIGKVVEDMDAQLIQFKAGEIDFASSVDATTCFKEYGQSEEFDASGAINYYITFNCNMEGSALQDKNVRRAIQLGIERQKICDALDAGKVYYPLNCFLPAGMPGAEKDWMVESGPLVYTDKEAAKKLLADAGYTTADKDGYVLTLEYYYNQSTLHDTIATVLKSELKEIGINVVLKTAELRTFFADRKAGLCEMARNAFSADYMDPSTYLNLPRLENQSVYVLQGDATYDAMLEKATTMTGAERMTQLHAAEKYLIEEMSYNCPLIGYGSAVLVKAGTTGYSGSPQANHLFWYVQTPAK